MCKYTHNCLCPPPPVFKCRWRKWMHSCSWCSREPLWRWRWQQANQPEETENGQQKTGKTEELFTREMALFYDFTVLIWPYKSKTKLVVFRMLWTCQLNCYIIYVRNLLRLKVFYNMGNVGSELYMSRVCALCNSFVSISSLRSYTSITVGVWRI